MTRRFLHYSLTKAPTAPITIDILDAAGVVVRHMSSATIPPFKSGGREFPDWWRRAPRPLPTEARATTCGPSFPSGGDPQPGAAASVTLPVCPALPVR